MLSLIFYFVVVMVDFEWRWCISFGVGFCYGFDARFGFYARVCVRGLLLGCLKRVGLI